MRRDGCAAVSDPARRGQERGGGSRPAADRSRCDRRTPGGWRGRRSGQRGGRADLHSGKTRARHTAAAWGEALGVPIDEADGLAPRDDPAIWAARVAAETRDMMLVGHLPHLARLAGLLLAGDPDRPLIAFRQGGLVGLEQGPAGWSVWLVLSPAAV